MIKVLILCTGNSCRSQIAHGFLEHYTNNSVKIFSAGIEKHGVNKNAIRCMNEIDIDISKHTSNKVDDYLDIACLLYTSPSPRDLSTSRMPSSA